MLALAKHALICLSDTWRIVIKFLALAASAG